MKKEINRTLGNSLRCILPSFWWKRLLGKMVDKIESAESSASSAMKMATLAGAEASDKQDRLVSGSNIKTINHQSILGSGNITIEAGNGVEQIIFYATGNDAYPLTAAEIAHNVESMQKQRTAFLNNTPVSFLVSVKGAGFQMCQTPSFYLPSNNTNIPVGFHIVCGGSTQVMVICNWDGTANAKDLNWIDTELSDTSKNPVQNKVIKAYVDEKVANSGGGSSSPAEIRELYVYKNESGSITELTDEQKAWNTETVELVEQGEAVAVIKDGTAVLTLSYMGSGKFLYTVNIGFAISMVEVTVTDGIATVEKGTIEADKELSSISHNPVKNWVITTALNDKVDKNGIKTINGQSLTGEGNIVIERGEKGDKGDKGDTGATGPQGPQGNSGYTGAAGELEIVNNLTDGGATAALSAEMGKTLDAKLTELSAEKGKFDDDALYVSDAKGNLIATINADGIRTTDIEVEGGKVSQLFAAILSKLDKEIDSDFFQIQDTNGNIAFRVDNGGVYLAKSDSWVVSVVLGDAYIPTSILRNEKGDVASAEIIFPDGQKGNIVITSQDANGVKGMTIGYNNKSIGVVIDRDSQGNVSKININ